MGATVADLARRTQSKSVGGLIMPAFERLGLLVPREEFARKPVGARAQKDGDG